MIDLKEELILNLSRKIKNFRKGELDFDINEKHVETWISQFSKEIQTDVLEEVIHIFNEWYLSREQIEQFLEAVLNCLMEKYAFDSVEGVLCEVSFPVCSLKGMSQIQLLQMLADYIEKEGYHQLLHDEINDKYSHYVYIDDGIFTGRTAKKEIDKLLDKLPANTTLDVFYIFGTTAGIGWIDKDLQDPAISKNVNLSIMRWKELSNRRSSYKDEDGNIIYEPRHRCLWPLSNLSSIQEVDTFKKNHIDAAKYHEYCPYRTVQYICDAGVFSNCERRELIEREFLLKGLEIMSYCREQSGMLPLGFDKWASFGLGSICATDLNISNTCPLVLWWGNVKKDGSVLDNWYPLLPRRTEGIFSVLDEDNADDYDLDDYYSGYDNGAYSTCPDCGCAITEINDGGNGFCWHCAWKH